MFMLIYAVLYSHGFNTLVWLHFMFDVCVRVRADYSAFRWCCHCFTSLFIIVFSSANTFDLMWYIFEGR